MSKKIDNLEKLNIDNFENGQEPSSDSLDERLFAFFESDNVPNNINIELKNKIYKEAKCSKRKIALWWMPAVLNTTIALAGIVFSIILYFIVRIGGSHTIIPNIINNISVFGIKVIILLGSVDIILGWLSTAIIIPIASGRNLSNGVKVL